VVTILGLRRVQVTSKTFLLSQCYNVDTIIPGGTITSSTYSHSILSVSADNLEGGVALPDVYVELSLSIYPTIWTGTGLREKKNVHKSQKKYNCHLKALINPES